MIRRIIWLSFLVIGVVVGLTVYLQPDDLKQCQEKPDNTAMCMPADAVVAISGGDTDARTNEAIRLFKNGWGKYLIFSGAAVDKSGPSNAFVMKQIAIDAGVSETLIYIDEKAETTKENALNLNDVFKDLGVNKIVLVTSGYHQRRAQLEFEKYTNNVEIISHPIASDKDWSIVWWLTPRGWWLAGGEIIKIIVLSLIGS